MIRRFFIGIIMLTGLFLMPAVSVACDMHADSQTNCCPQKAATPSASGVPVNDVRVQKIPPHQNCEGWCNPSSCRCGALNVVVALPAVSIANAVDLSERKELLISLIQDTTRGFYSIWLPPKIA